MIARLFAQVGWVSWPSAWRGAARRASRPAAGRRRGGREYLAAVALSPRCRACLALFGLFSVMMAAQTRAAIDSADIAREMLVLAAAADLPSGSRAALGEDVPLPRRPASPRSTPAAEHAEATPTARVPDADPIADPVRCTCPRGARGTAHAAFGRESAPEPGRTLGPSRSSPPARGRGLRRKPHPIFTARPRLTPNIALGPHTENGGREAPVPSSFDGRCDQVSERSTSSRVKISMTSPTRTSS